MSAVLDEVKVTYDSQFPTRCHQQKEGTFHEKSENVYQACQKASLAQQYVMVNLTQPITAYNLHVKYNKRAYCTVRIPT